MAPKGAANQRRANDRAVMSNQRVHTESDRFVDFFFLRLICIFGRIKTMETRGAEGKILEQSHGLSMTRFFPLIGRLMSRKLRLCTY